MSEIDKPARYPFDDYKPVENVHPEGVRAAMEPPKLPENWPTEPSLTTDGAASKVAAESVAPRVTEESIRAKIDCVQYIVHETMTICIITMRSGFKVTGTAAPASPANFKSDVGQRYAYDKAFRQLWEFEGYLLCESLHRSQR